MVGWAVGDNPQGQIVARGRSWSCNLRSQNVEVVILNQGEEDFRRLGEDVLEIITVFSARFYGSRSRKNQKLLDGVKRLSRTRIVILFTRLNLYRITNSQTILLIACRTSRFATTGPWLDGTRFKAGGKPKKLLCAESKTASRLNNSVDA